MKDQETRSREREELHKERLDRLERMVYSQHEKLDKLESLVYRVMHRDRVGYDGNKESPKHEEEAGSDHENDTDQDIQTPEITHKREVTARIYPIPSI